MPCGAGAAGLGAGFAEVAADADGFVAGLAVGRVAVAVRAAPVVLFATDVAGREEVTTLSAALVFGIAGAVGVGEGSVVSVVSVVSTTADVAASLAGVSALGARTNETFCDLAVGCEGRAVVCDRRAACA